MGGEIGEQIKMLSTRVPGYVRTYPGIHFLNMEPTKFRYWLLIYYYYESILIFDFTCAYLWIVTIYHVSVHALYYI
eukprot:SAG31_NODE_20_length_34168_cov_33.651296_37_plen_76_part_00